jgi:DNA-binding transcriptional regulator YiaG
VEGVSAAVFGPFFYWNITGEIKITQRSWSTTFANGIIAIESWELGRRSLQSSAKLLLQSQ